MLRRLSFSAVVLALCVCSSKGSAAIVKLTSKIHRVAVSAESNSVQVFLVDKFDRGSCTADYKVGVPLGTDFANVTTSLAMAGMLAGKRVEVEFDNTTCIGSAPTLVWLKVLND